jgi:uncharacterized membrane protein YdjX (TVP38/TMEM64 family)
MSHELRDLVTDAGIVGPLVFVAAEAAITMLFLPRSPGAIVAGAAFGTVGGTALAWLAMMLGAAASFYVVRAGRRAGGRAASWLSDSRNAQLEPWVRRVDAWMERRGPLAILYTRLVPGLPFTSINYAAGLTRVPAGHFMIATGVGILPSTFALVALGGSISHPTSARFIALIAVVIALAVAAPIVDRALRRDQPGPAP